MNEKFIKKEFEKMKFPDIDVKENVLNSINNNSRVRRKMRPRAVLVFALSIIMITGVVFAASRMINVAIEEPADDEIARYNINLDIEGIDLVEEVKEDLLTFALDINTNLVGAIGEEYMKFVNSYNQAEEYLGVKLLQSSILNNTIEPSSILYEKIDGEKGINIQSSRDKEEILSVNIFSQHRIPNTSGIISLGIYLRTPEGKELYGDRQLLVGHFDFEDDSLREVFTETYMSKTSGITAEIVHIAETERYAAYFAKDSILYSLDTSYAGEGLDPKELLIEVLDSFK